MKMTNLSCVFRVQGAYIAVATIFGLHRIQIRLQNSISISGMHVSVLCAYTLMRTRAHHSGLPDRIGFARKAFVASLLPIDAYERR